MDFDISVTLGYIIGVIGIIGTAYFGYKSIKTKKPVYTKKNSNIIVDNVQSYPGLNVTFHDEPLQNLSSTTITFWNKGNERIDKDDIASTDPLQINAKEDIKLFSVNINKKSNFANAFTLGPVIENKFVKFTFEYLSRREGAEIVVIHSGKSSDDIEISGTIKDAGSPVNLDSRYRKPIYHFLFVKIPDLLTPFLILFFALVIISKDNPLSFLIYMILITLVAFFGAGGYYKIITMGSPKFEK
jgi:hypothetical protein